ncbi:hypothetical protein ACLOJK_034612 [Asimina triloba]
MLPIVLTVESEEDGGPATGSEMGRLPPSFCTTPISRSELTDGGSCQQLIGEDGASNFGARVGPFKDVLVVVLKDYLGSKTHESREVSNRTFYTQNGYRKALDDIAFKYPVLDLEVFHDKA